MFVEHLDSDRANKIVTQICDYFERKCHFWKNKVETGNHDLTIVIFILDLHMVSFGMDSLPLILCSIVWLLLLLVVADSSLLQKYFLA